MKFLWFFPYHNTILPFLFEKKMEGTWQEPARFFHLLEKWCHWHSAPSSLKMELHKGVCVLCVTENFWLSSHCAKSEVEENEKWDLRGQLFPSWVSSSDLHQCHLPRLFAMPFKKSWSGLFLCCTWLPLVGDYEPQNGWLTSYFANFLHQGPDRDFDGAFC